MRSLGTVTPWIATAVFLTCARTKACPVVVHYSKAQIEAADLRLYERDVHTRDLDITRFDQKHPLIGQVLGNQQFYEQELHAWQSHPAVFDHEHPGLSRVLEGDMLYHKKHPYEPPTLTVPPEVSQPGNCGGCVPSGPGQPGDSNPDTGIQTASVPEPATGVLALTALIVGLVAARRRPRSNTHPEAGGDLNG
jgi:MYXO-CTERM domain-containing protein